MKPAPFDYARPGTLLEAIALLAAGAGMARVLAGGQSLVPMLNLRLATIDQLIDVRALAELKGVSDLGDRVRIGACTTHAAIEDGLPVDPSRGLLGHVASRLAYRAVRTRGTVGGSLALADPSAEWPAVLTALDATVELAGPGGARRLALAEFVQGAYATALAEDEILVAVEVPKLSQVARWGFYKLCRKTGEYAASLAVVRHDPSRGPPCLVVGATGGAPLRLERAAAIAFGKPDAGALRQAIRADLAAAPHGFDSFALEIHEVSMIRAIRQASS